MPAHTQEIKMFGSDMFCLFLFWRKMNSTHAESAGTAAHVVDDQGASSLIFFIWVHYKGPANKVNKAEQARLKMTEGGITAGINQVIKFSTQGLNIY